MDRRAARLCLRSAAPSMSTTVLVAVTPLLLAFVALMLSHHRPHHADRQQVPASVFFKQVGTSADWIQDPKIIEHVSFHSCIHAIILFEHVPSM